jgi:hypothetical protein
MRKETLPEMCLVFIESAEPGHYIGAVKNGERGYFATTYDEKDPEKAKALVSLINERLGVSALESECMLTGSMFGWKAPGADPEVQARASAKAHPSAR